MMDLVVFGAGGMGRELMWQLSESKDSGFNLLGFVDDSPEKQGNIINGFSVLGDTEWLLKFDKEIGVAVALGDCSLRKAIVNKLKANKNIKFPNIIAPDVIFSQFVDIGEGCIICYGSIITVNIKIGDFFLCNRSCNIGHDDVIGDFVTLNPNVTLSGNVTVGDCTNIGTGACVIPGKGIGSNAVVGACAAVISDIPDNCTVVGVPARPN